MKLGAVGYLILALVLLGAWSGFATFRWLTAGARCDTRLAEAVANAQADAREQTRRNTLTAAGIFAAESADLAVRLVDAAGATNSRDVLIREVRVTGACVMPAGLPSLQPAVEEARRAARD